MTADPPETAATVVHFTAEEEAGRWYAVNDGVMGGVSAGAFRVEDGRGVFAGRVSLENDGGFASVWRRPERIGFLAGTVGLRLRVRGDGNAYRVRLAMPDTRDDVSYQAEIETVAGRFTEHELSYADFVPRFRGRRVAAPPLDPARIGRLGLLISGGQEGPFRLEIEWIAGVG